MCKYNGWVRPTIYQGMYNIITRNIDTEVFAACRRYGLGIATYNAVGEGFFSGKIRQGVTPEDGRFSDLTRAGPRYREPYYRDGVFQALRLLGGILVVESTRVVFHYVSSAPRCVFAKFCRQFDHQQCRFELRTSLGRKRPSGTQCPGYREINNHVVSLKTPTCTTNPSLPNPPNNSPLTLQT